MQNAFAAKDDRLRMALAAAHAQLKSLLLAALVKGFRVLSVVPRRGPIKQ